MAVVTVAFAIHRPELIPAAERVMRQHEAIFLEEPPESGFEAMLAGRLGIEDYLLAVDVEFPAFSVEMCRRLRRLHEEGRQIFQVEPYLEGLAAIHEFFAEGGSPEGLQPDTLPFYIHRAERSATGALIAYYGASARGGFEEAVAAVVRFARADAARLRLRDSLRAQALAARVAAFDSSYVECGEIHFALWRELRRRLPAGIAASARFLGREALAGIGAGRRPASPGDALTLRYVFNPPGERPPTTGETLWAARAMIHAKILGKEEQAAGEEPFPHLMDELRCTRAVGRLSLEQCRALFAAFRRAGTEEARRLLELP